MQGFAARLSDGRVIVGGGFSAAGVSTTAVDIYNPATNSWSSAAALPSPPEPMAVSAEAQTLSDGKVAVMGIGPFGNSTEIYSPEAGGPPVAPPAENCTGLAGPGPGPGPSQASGSSNTAGGAGTSTGGSSLAPTSAALTFAVAALKVKAGGAIRLTIRARGAGRFTATARSGRLTYGHTAVQVTHAETITLVIAPTRKAKALLSAGRTLHLTVMIVFQAAPRGGGSKRLVKVTVHGRPRHG